MAARKGATRARERSRDPEAPPPSLGADVCDWLEHYLVHGPGDVAGRPYQLHDDLRRFVWQAYELRPDGTRAWPEAVLCLPKGWAKSEATGALCCVEALGPVRFDGWDAAGDPVGAPVEYSLVEIYAADLDQTDNTYGNVGYMLGSDTCADALLRDYGRVDIGRHEESSTRVVLPGHRGTIIPKSSRARTKQGGKPTFVATEELHEWLLPELHRLYRTKVKDLIKRAGTWALHATNMFGEGEGSVCESVRTDWEAGAEILWFGGSVPKGLLPESVPLKQVPDDTLRAALRAVYGSASAFAGFDRMIGDLRRATTKEGEWRRFFLNQPFTADRSFVDADDWRSRLGPARIGDRERVGLGFVGTDRCVALVACSIESRLIEPVAVWEDVEPSPAAVDRAVAGAFERFRVARMLGNPWGWRTELDTWAGRYGSKVVLRFPLREDRRMREALDRWGSSPWRHTGDDTLRAHVLGCSTRTERIKTENGVKHVPVNLEPKEAHLWIVAAQAAVLAHEAACQALAAPAPPPAPVRAASAPRPPGDRPPSPSGGRNGLRAGNRIPGRRL